jgi:D-alanine-D-alanine ligase-like ATP-grasp enzyme
MSSFLRQAEHATFHTVATLAHWELAGARVINGTSALSIDTSKSRQLSLLTSLGLSVPRTRAVHRCTDLQPAASELGFPVIVKPNIGGSGSGVVRYDTLSQLAAAVDARQVPAGLDGVTLVQDYVPARAGRVIRCETLNGKFLYAIALSGAGTTFDLCPADVCLVDKPSIAIEAYTPSPDIITAVEAIARAAHLDVGGIEYLVDDRDGTARFYDINALSNFVANPLQILGWDPHDNLIDYLADTLTSLRRAA